MNLMQVGKIRKPWGWELLYAKTDKYVGKVLFVMAGHRLSLQFHKQKHETLFLYTGKAVCELENMDWRQDGQMEQIDLNEQSIVSVAVKPFQKHRITAIEDSIILEVSTPELDDVVRVEDDYGRES